MRTSIYVDGFNLYYGFYGPSGCLKGSQDKWIDLKELFRVLLKPKNQITQIKYFTACVKSKPTDVGAPDRQRAYISALKAYTPEISVHYGRFIRPKVRMAAANPPPNTVEVMKTEEKGSDVNLAVHLLNDAWLNEYDCAVVVSNDSDIEGSMKLIRAHHSDKVLGLINPGHKNTSRQLGKHAHFTKIIRPSAILASQLPNPIPGTVIHKPNDWT